MQNMQRDLKTRLKSRKLWLSIASFVSMLIIYFGGSESEATQVAALIMAGATVIGYVIGEGLSDSPVITTEENFYYKDEVEEEIDGD